MSPIPSDEKIVFTRRTQKHAQCVKVDWSDSDTSVDWISIFYWLGVAKIWDSVISEISSNCIPEGSFVCTKLHPFDSKESRQMREDPLITPLRKNGSKGGARSRIRAIIHKGNFVSLSRDQITRIYSGYLGPIMGHSFFIVSRNEYPALERDLTTVSNLKIKRKLLQRVYFVQFNHYDHGFEIIGHSLDSDTFLKVAEDVSRNYDLPLQIQDQGHPFGNP